MIHLTKTLPPLKSSNKDLREELNNNKFEMNELSEQLVSLKNDLVNANKNNISLKENCSNYQVIISQLNVNYGVIYIYIPIKNLMDELQTINVSLKSDISILEVKLANFVDTNHKLKVIVFYVVSKKCLKII